MDIDKYLRTWFALLLFVGAHSHILHNPEYVPSGSSLSSPSFGQCRSDRCDCHDLHVNHRQRCASWLYHGVLWHTMCDVKLRCSTPVRHCCVLTDWFPCDKSCGGGIQQRTNRCADRVGGQPQKCETTTTIETRTCNSQSCPGCTTTTPFINEFHYDNTGGDIDEFIEIAGLAGADLTGYTLSLYNGNNGAMYDEQPLGTLSDDGTSTIGFLEVSYSTTAIQNGDPDGIALTDQDDNVVQFISYEGSFTAVGGKADGEMSTDIGIKEDGGTAVGTSLQLIGTSCDASGFTWTSGSFSRGAVNAGQTFSSQN